jgi:ATP-dependent protease Clp ATPase subunit
MKRRFNTNVVVTDEFVDALAQKAHDSGCGARSLYKEFRKATKIAEAGISLMDKNVQKELVLTPEMINDNTKFDVITDIKVKTLHR